MVACRCVTRCPPASLARFERGDLAVVIGELTLADLAHGDEELVDGHRRVDGDLAAEIIVDVALLDRARRVVAD